MCTAHGRYERGIDTEPPYNLALYGMAPSLESFAHCHDASYASVFGARTAVPIAAGQHFHWQNWTYVVPGEPACSDANYANWCDAFANRSVLLVGDSLMEHQVISLLALLSLAAPPRAGAAPPRKFDAALARRVLRLDIDGTPKPVCGGRGTIGFVRNDYACEQGWAAECTTRGAGGSNRRPFAAAASRYDTLVLNAGVHVLASSRVAVHAEALARWLNGTGHSAIWRTAVPGHVSCQNASAPLSRHYSPLDGAGKDVYGWGQVEEHNRLRASVFDRILGSGRMRYLDAAAIANRRADRHLLFRPKHNLSAPYAVFDCLHYCLPGPPDDVRVWDLNPRAP